MNSIELRVFECVARLGGIGKAARELGTVQSNVTARILALEGELGKSLFYRHARGVSLTRAGESLLPYAVRLARLLAEARRALEDGEPSGALVLGTIETTAAVRMPPVLVEYRRSYPEVELTLLTGTTASLVQDVLDYKLEGAFVTGPVGHTDLHEEPVFEEELVLLSADSRTSLREALRSDSVVVFRAGCSYRQRLDEYLAKDAARTRRRLEFGTLDGILGCVAADLGITVLPRAVAERAAAGSLRIHELPRNDARIATVFVRRHDAVTTRAMVEFVDCAKRHGNRPKRARSSRQPKAASVSRAR